ncbi:hypothetical protein F444_18119 [Plasmopara halstedii]|uniref:ubiquitinyl hydrolase 1 n=1 Tax=Plasmopara halstedii TaxID=4781 RepID=A0A0P1ACA6_PLAHL|nr:hypothetical protein F444_18119 [Plasmopara halstedii]CEG37976.1 hypothetical protein F444_18119 [Plasmopara halstedii]|eukprot:XP_024574345.1 hypothetical protein F444_18119 [Plasmopara halstedii]
MVEKRRSPAADSPPATQRRKKLITKPDDDSDAMDIETFCDSAIDKNNESSINPNVKSTEAIHSPDKELSKLIFHETFQSLALDNEQIATDIKRDTRGDTWRVVWQPRSATDSPFVGVFVELVAQEITRSRLAEVSVMLMNQRKQPSVIKHTSIHEFSEENAVFGMRQFIERSVLLNPINAYVDEQGQVEVEVILNFVEDVEALKEQMAAETTKEGLAYDTKAKTGMVGLKNQGATCYLNSLLQTLYHLRAFRQVVYETPTAQEDTNESVSLALQRVFYRLQSKEKAVSTKELTRSFGWSTIDSFMQHDVQELYRILCDRLEEKMKQTRMDSAIQKLFEGKVRSFVQCVNVEFQSFRDECFYDLQLDVKGCKDLMQSFRKYVEVELLEGDNQYEAEGHGKQDAKKGIEFLTLPPVLNIQLKRFEYDPMRDGMVKVHDRFEYPKTLVLDEFIAQKDEKTKNDTSRYCYHLHSVLVHSGDVHGGHYYVFIRPGKQIATSTDWFKFDDDQITHVDEKVAIEGNFGSGGTLLTPQDAVTAPPSPLYGNSHFYSPNCNTSKTADPNNLDGCEFHSVDTVQVAGMYGTEDEYNQSHDSNTLPPASCSNNLALPLGRNFSSAYMLVYVRDGENDISAIQDTKSTAICASEAMSRSDNSTESSKVLSWQVDPLPIPQELVMRFREEEKTTARRKKEQQTEHLYMNFRIASDTSIAKLKRITPTTDFAGFNNSSTVRIRIKRTAPIRQLYRQVYRATGVPMSRIRLWKVITRENRTTRPDQALGPEYLSYCVESLIEDDASLKAPVKLFLQILNDLSKPRCQGTFSPVTLPSSPTTIKPLNANIYRHFLNEFMPPVLGDGADGEDAVAIVECAKNDFAPRLNGHDILLFVKFYDVTKEIGERLEYMGNIVVDSQMTGAELATYLHEALSIPRTKDLVLYEEVQPTTVAMIHSMATLAGSEIQNGDIICFQYAEDDDIVNEIVLKPEGHDDEDPEATELSYVSPVGEEVETIIIEKSDRAAMARNESMEKYPDVPSYFQYLLDRIDIVFYCYGHMEEKSFTLPLLLSNVYDEVIDAVAAHLGLAESQRLFVRLYQHSPINNSHVKSPLRHSRYAGDQQTTLEDLLTEYIDRTNILYYEILERPITEFEAKKEVFVYLSAYDACFATEQTASPSFTATPRRIEVLVLPTDRVCDLLQLIRDVFDLPRNTLLRACEVVQHGTMINHVLKEDQTLSRFLGIGDRSNSNRSEILIEQIPLYELVDNQINDKSISDTEHIEWIYKGVVHFNYQKNSRKWIHPHGVPCIVRFHEEETVGDVKERIRQRMGVSSIVFAQWNFALVKDLKASTLSNVYEEMDVEALDAFPMSRLTELCGADFEGLGSLGLEHAAPTPTLRHHNNRRLETGIHIR